MVSRPRVSVVISTHNREAVLPRALTALLCQEGGIAHEIIAVDNASTDGTAAIIRSKLRSHPHLRYVFEPLKGLPHGRNAGIRAARGAIVAFTDDDVEVPRDWVAKISRTFDAHPDVDVIGGRVVPVWPRSLPTWLTKRQLGPLALGERGDVPIRLSAENAAPCLVGANFAFRRCTFERVGLFDPAYTKSQDREIQLRLWRAGGVGLYVPDLVMSVEVPEERLTKQYFRYWYATYGRYHSRMKLLDRIDHAGRLTEPAGRQLLGVPAFIYRALLRNTKQWFVAAAMLDGDNAFYHENRVRYLFSYVRARYSERVTQSLSRWNAHENTSRRAWS